MRHSWESPGKLSTGPATVALFERDGVSSTAMRYRKNEKVFLQGSHADRLFYLQRGKVTSSMVSKQGKEAILTILTAGSFFGEGCLAGENVHLVTVTALVDSMVLAFRKKDVLAAIQSDSHVAESFITYLLERKSRIEEDLMDQLCNSSEKRLARVLLLLASFGKDQQLEGVLPSVSQDTLARMIGTTRPRVNFFMNKFRRLGIIDYQKDNAHVHRTLLTQILRD